IGLAYEAVSPVSKTIPIGLVYSATLPPEALQSIPIELLKTAYSTLLAYNSIPVSLAYEVSVQLPGYYVDWWTPFAFVSGETEDPKKPSIYLLEATHKTGKANMIPPSELYTISLAYNIDIYGVDDFDLDGVKEFVIGDATNNALSMCNASDGSFEWILLNIFNPSYGCVADFNNDGKADRIIHPNETSLECRKADGTLEWSVAGVYCWVGYYSMNSIVVFDIDGDGVVEIIVGNENYMYMIHPDGSIERNVAVDGTGAKWVWDFDADGSPELVTFYPGNLYCFTGVFGLKWNTATISPAGASPSSACKIDSDDIYELVICGFYISTPAYLRCHKLSDGAALWSYDTAQLYAFSNYLAFDIDGDGLGETVFGCSNDSCMVCLAWDGTAKWLISGFYRCALSVCDFNNDGYYEILACGAVTDLGPAVRAFISHTGSVLWSVNYDVAMDYYPSHVISNVYGDERVEVIALSIDGVIRCWTSPA
ncbi:MAG: VCBS repeat-containing protein, partial [Candidatus Bathyarchaeia archaeon]